ncbi:MAG: DUF1893 domain-containing protein [Endomicrobia bacterium]|nr:DUF1893 domain-containing protein [Endomicrobiia bacterium]MCL2799550.1 DUF1893 domain-containing protein [Endomicrobiia bacterium]
MKKQSFLIFSVVLLFFAAIISGCAAANKKSISLNELKELSQNHALVVAYNGGVVKTYDDNGIKPLFKHLENGNFKNAYVFDKVTGKASSLILVYGGAAELYTGILSKEAIPVLEKYNVKYSADKIVDYITNKSGDDKCPMEKTVSDIDDPEEAYKILKEKFDR